MNRAFTLQVHATGETSQAAGELLLAVSTIELAN